MEAEGPAAAVLSTPLAAVLDGLPDAAFLYDAQGRVVRANATGRALFGLDAAPEFAALPFEQRVARLDARDAEGRPLDPERWYITQLLQGQAITSEAPLDATITTLDGRERMMSFTGAPIHDAGGALIGAIALGRDVTAQRQAERAMREAHDRLAALQVVLDTALAHLSPDALVRELLDRIREAMHADNAAILLAEDGGSHLIVQSARGPEEEVVGTARVPIGQGFAGRIAASRAPLLVDDLKTFEVANPLLREHFRSLAGVPLLVEDRLLGVLHVDSVEPRHFTADDLRLLELVAERVALAIDRAQLYSAAEQARRIAAARAHELETFFGTLTDAVMLFGMNGEVTLLNPAARALLSPEPAPGHFDRPLAERGTRTQVYDEHGNPLALAEWPYSRILRGEVLTGANAVDVVYTWASGHTMQVSVSGAPVRDADGGITGALCILHDVTERRQLERRTHEALEALLAMAQALVLGDAEPDPDPDSSDADTLDTHSVRRVRAAARRLAELNRRVLGCDRVAITAVDPESEATRPLAVVGLTPKQEAALWANLPTNTRLSDTVGPADIARLRAGETLTADLGEAGLDDERNAYRARSVLVAPCLLRGQLIGVLTTDYGSTLHQFTADEVALAGAVAQLVALVIERERLLRERAAAEATALAYEEANRRMNEFLGIASHELRTPVTVIKANLQLLTRRRQSSQSSQSAQLPVSERRSARDTEMLLVDRSERQVERLARLVEDMVDVARVQQGKLELRLEPHDLLGVMREEVEQQRHAHPRRTIRLDLPEDSALLAWMDPDRIAQVVNNYLTNALKYSEVDRPVEVRVSVEGEMVRVSVRDEGPGLPPEQQERVWEMFHRAPGVTVQTGSGVGLGLGLHIARSIIERHGGQVGVESAVGSGSTFWFTLPLVPADATDVDVTDMRTEDVPLV
jgi:signal transduction histidine kinase/PAS domain-containing protein